MDGLHRPTRRALLGAGVVSSAVALGDGPVGTFAQDKTAIAAREGNRLIAEGRGG
jgi:hypothetical protein